MAIACFPFWIGAYQADTQTLSTIQHGAYLLLMLHYYQHGRLPDDESTYPDICKLDPRTFARMKPKLAQFFEMPGWRHKRIDAELEKIKYKKAIRAHAGRLGGLNSRGQNNNERFLNAHGVPKQMLKQTGANPEKKVRTLSSEISASDELATTIEQKGWK
jgi:uncharacterized protein YdaU (DUF1376 family)